jgi:hypothetical protein
LLDLISFHDFTIQRYEIHFSKLIKKLSQHLFPHFKTGAPAQLKVARIALVAGPVLSTTWPWSFVCTHRYDVTEIGCDHGTHLAREISRPQGRSPSMKHRELSSCWRQKRVAKDSIEKARQLSPQDVLALTIHEDVRLRKGIPHPLPQLLRFSLVSMNEPIRTIAKCLPLSCVLRSRE